MNAFDQNDPSLQCFTATGKAFQPVSKQEKEQYARSSMGVADAMGHGPANFLPVKFTDESLISVPVIRPEDIGKTATSQDTRRRSIFTSKRKANNENFTIKQVPRRDYLKYYAKDDAGKYCGTEEPAKDCILRGDDLTKYRQGITEFSNEILDPPPPYQSRQGSMKGVIR